MGMSDEAADTYYNGLFERTMLHLEDHPAIENIQLAARDGASEQQVQQWEARHGTLPADLKNFFQLCDGLEPPVPIEARLEA